MNSAKLDQIAAKYNAALAKLNANETVETERALDAVDQELCNAISAYLKSEAVVEEILREIPFDFTYDTSDASEKYPTKRDFAWEYLWGRLTTP